MKKNKDTKSNFLLLQSIWSNFKPKRKIQFVILTFLILISAILEVFSLISIIPLINFLIAPDKLMEKFYIKYFINFWGIENTNNLIFPIVFGFIVTVLFSTTFRIATQWNLSRFAGIVGADFNRQAFSNNLYQPYSIHSSRNSSDLVALHLLDINAVVNAINNSLKIITSLVISFFIILTLLIYDLNLGILSFIIFSSSYFSITFFSKFILTRNSKFVADARKKQIKLINEGLGSIRDVLLNNTYKFYIGNFSTIEMPMRLRISQNSFISTFPRALIESIAFVYLASLSLYIVVVEKEYSSVLLKIGFIAISCQKLLPQLQQTYAAWSRISSQFKSIVRVLDALNQPYGEIENNLKKNKLICKNGIELKNVYFKYSNNRKYILKGIDLEIKKGEKIGIIGNTGSGKSTLIDLIIGMIPPSKGEIIIDNKKITDTKKLNDWRSSISYIPQNIYLSDTSIIENIACGVKRKNIDVETVIKSLEIARIYDFVKNLPYGYETIIGELGSTISGGQRQRLGIARGVFNIINNKKELLVLDESTSALDIEIEKSVMDSLYDFSEDITLIMVSHRYSTLSNCERILKIENGLILKEGNPRNMLIDY